MKTTPELEAEIVRLHYAEHWPVGTIAAQLDAHPDVVRRVLGLSTARPPSQLRPRLVDPYRPFIDETLQRYPKLLATRLYDMIRERGFAGSIRTLREHVAAVRPKPRREVYLSTETMLGEQAQVDWAYVDKLVVPGGERALWLFVMVLAHSRALWAEFVLDLSVHSLVRSLVRASAWFGGVTRQWLFEYVPRHIFVFLFRPPICGRGIDFRGHRCNGAALLGHIWPVVHVGDDTRRNEVVMLERYFVRPETVDRIRASWIASSIERYVAWLAEHGYSATCVEYRVPLLVRFGAFARGRGARTASALPRHVDAFVADWLRRRCSPHRKDPRNPGREVSGPIEQMLRIVLPKSVGDRDRRSRQKPEPFRRQAPGFFAYLRGERGLREATVHHYMFYLRAFESYLDSIKLRRLRDLSPPILTAFVAQRAASLGKCGVRDSCGTLRVFLRYLHRERTIGRDLSAAIERPRSYRLSAIPRSITWEEVRRVLTCIDRRSSTGRRDYAMLLLLVTYGLRAREVAALTLDDIDWKSERVMVPGRKAGHSTAYPLSAVVGNALLEYIRRGRPDTKDRHIFFRAVAPPVPITHSAVSCRAARYLRKAGVSVPRPGSHTLRHTCAQRLVDADFSLKEIGDYLGHRSADATRIYAKVAVEALRKVALGDGEDIL